MIGDDLYTGGGGVDGSYACFSVLLGGGERVV